MRTRLTALAILHALVTPLAALAQPGPVIAPPTPWVACARAQQQVSADREQIDRERRSLHVPGPKAMILTGAIGLGASLLATVLTVPVVANDPTPETERRYWGGFGTLYAINLGVVAGGLAWHIKVRRENADARERLRSHRQEANARRAQARQICADAAALGPA